MLLTFAEAERIYLFNECCNLRVMGLLTELEIHADFVHITVWKNPRHRERISFQGHEGSGFGAPEFKPSPVHLRQLPKQIATLANVIGCSKSGLLWKLAFLCTAPWTDEVPLCQERVLNFEESNSASQKPSGTWHNVTKSTTVFCPWYVRWKTRKKRPCSLPVQSLPQRACFSVPIYREQLWKFWTISLWG